MDQRACLVLTHDYAALDAGLARILDDPALAARLREGCQGSWAELLAQMETLCRKLISERDGE